jgi:hypothetical protein
MHENIDAQNARNSSNRAYKKLSTTPTFLFNGYVIITLHPDWVKAFGALPTIEAYLEEGHLCLKTLEVVRK